MITWLAWAAIAPITLAFGGDVMLGRGVERAGVFPFGASAHVLREADLAFVNLECPLTERPFQGHKVVHLRAKPERAAWLAEAGIDVVSVANNHAGDCGAEGLRDTVTTLEGVGISAAGLADRTVVREIRGTRIGFLATTDFRRDAVTGMLVVAPERLEAEVRALAARVDHVVVSIHWGVEGTDTPTPRQRELAKRALAGGARVVVGHGPHTIQRVEGPVAYSLGDLVFDRRGERAVWVVEIRGTAVRGQLWREGSPRGGWALAR